MRSTSKSHTPSPRRPKSPQPLQARPADYVDGVALRFLRAVRATAAKLQRGQLPGFVVVARSGGEMTLQPRVALAAFFRSAGMDLQARAAVNRATPAGYVLVWAETDRGCAWLQCPVTPKKGAPGVILPSDPLAIFELLGETPGAKPDADADHAQGDDTAEALAGVEGGSR